MAVLLGTPASGDVPGGLGAETPTAPVAAAVVNGEIVSTEDFEHHLKRLHGGAENLDPAAFDIGRLAFRVVNDVLIGQEARAMELHLEPRISRQTEAWRHKVAVGRLEYEEIAQHARPTEEEVETAYQEQYRRATFRVITTDEKKSAEQVLSELRAGADVEALAKERSVDPYRLRGGLVKSLAAIDLQRDVAQLLFSLSPGALAGPVQTDLGWSVFRLESYEPADPGRFESTAPLVSAVVRQRKAAARRTALAAELIKRHPVHIDQAVVAQMAPQRRSDGRLMPGRPAGSPPVATIGDEQTITVEEYADVLLGRWQGVRSEEAARAAAPIVLDRLIEQKLLLAEALARKYDETPETVRAAKAYETQLLIPEYLEEVVAEGIEITESEKRAYFEEHKNEFHKPPRVHLGQMTLTSREEALRVALMLRGGADLAWLAKQRSTDRFKDVGGDRGWHIPAVGVEDYNEDLFHAQIGDVLEPFGAADNFVVLKVLDREEQGLYEYEEVAGNVRDRVHSAKFQERLDSLIKKLRERSDIVIHDDVLSSLGISGTIEEQAKESPH
jgi:parvulin-like peptidyl-prolyl isomerase